MGFRPAQGAVCSSKAQRDIGQSAFGVQGSAGRRLDIAGVLRGSVNVLAAFSAGVIVVADRDDKPA
jgi:hypothetical protein